MIAFFPRGYMRNFLLMFILSWVSFSFAQENIKTLGTGLEELGFQSTLYRDIKINQLIKLKLHNRESVKLVAENDQASFQFEFFYGYEASDFELFKTMFYRPFLGVYVERFNALMFELMSTKNCQPHYLPFEIHLNVARKFPILIYRSLDTVQRSWRFSCDKKNSKGVNYWGTFYQPKLKRVVTFHAFFPIGKENEHDVKSFLLNLKEL